MPSRRPFVLTVTACLMASCFHVSSLITPSLQAEAPESTVGWADSKPADGPSVEVDGKFMVPYAQRIPGTDLSFEMIPVPGGSYLMGSPDEEDDRNDDEGPQVQVAVNPMWVAKTEVTWGQYQEYMNLYAIFKEFESEGIRPVTDENQVDVITAPTELYDSSFTYEYGQEPDQAAVTMTQYSAQQFTKWLSRTTGQQYRLPTEGEWEYAARGGTTTAYFWGDDPDEADKYAWYFDNADEGQAAVGLLEPNPFGLHDMLGNAAEWTVNQYTEDYSSLKSDEPIAGEEAVVWPETGTSCVVRGGSWEMDIEDLRSAVRLESDDDEWKSEDPNFPLSPWWFTSDPARGVGFRLFRSHQPMDDEAIAKFWDPSAEDILMDVESRIVGGRGGQGIVDPLLAEAIKSLED